jgi:PAS domain S-box-containing protein
MGAGEMPSTDQQTDMQPHAAPDVGRGDYLVVDADRRVRAIGAGLRRLLAVPEGEIIGLDVAEAATRYLAPRLQGGASVEQILALLENNEPTSLLTVQMRDPGGARRWLLVSCDPAPAGTDTPLLVIRFQDIIGGMNTRLFKVALNHSSVVVFAQDRDLRYTWSYNQQFGHSDADVIGKTDVDLFLPEDAARLTAIKRRVIETGAVVHEEVAVTVEGRVRIRDLTLEPLRYTDGTIIGLSGTAFDVTDRHRVEEALRESEERFRSVFEEAGIGIVLMDLDWTIIRSNPAFCRMLGYDEDELQGRSVAENTHPDDVAANRTLFFEMVIGQRNRFQLEKRYITKEGRIVWGRLTATLLRDARGAPRFAVSMIEDVTDRKLVEAVRRDAYEQIEHNMEQFAILGDHVRHPLQVILARADLMDDEETAEKIREQVRRINEYITQLDQGWVESRKIREFLRRNELV